MIIEKVFPLATYLFSYEFISYPGKALVAYAEVLAKSEDCHFMKTDTAENADGVPWRSCDVWIRMGYEILASDYLLFMILGKFRLLKD